MKPLKQDFTLSFDYTRSTGPIIGRFLTELRDRRIVGIRLSDGQVAVPPLEFDPVTAEALSEIVPVKQTGVVTSWCWVHHPREKHPLRQPFAWALIRLDGADYPMAHAVDAGKKEHMRTGLKVRARWVKETKGLITDIECFEPCDE
jgi:uncharacterized OB-fold protein